MRPIVFNSRFNFFEIFYHNSQGHQMKVRQPSSYNTCALKTVRHIKSIMLVFMLLCIFKFLWYLRCLIGFLGSSYHKMISCAANQFQYWNLLEELTEVAPESTIWVSKHVDSRKRSQDPSKHLKFRVLQRNSCSRVSFLIKLQASGLQLY